MSDGEDRRQRRRWSEDFTRGVVAEAMEPGATVASVALSHGLNANLVFNWRRRHGGPEGFLPVAVSEPAPAAASVDRSGGEIEILQSDAYAGYGGLGKPDRKPAPVREAQCWAHAGRKFFELADIEAAAR